MVALPRRRVLGPPTAGPRLTGERGAGALATLRRWVRVRPAEWPVARTLFLWFFCLMALQHLLKPARNAYFLSTAGAANLPWAYIATALASALAMAAYGRWVAPLSRARQVLGAQAVVLASLLAFWLVLGAPTSWTAGGFYVWIQVFSLLLISQFFLVGNDLYDPRQAKRVFGFIGAGGLAGGTVGSAAAGFLANEIGTRNLLWLAVGLLGACLALAAHVFRISEARTIRQRDRSGEPEPTGGRIAGGLALVRRMPHLKMIALALFMAMVVSTFVDWIYNAAVEAAHESRERQAEFLGQSFAIFNGVALALQLFLTSRILHVAGLAGAMLLLPLGVGLGTASVVLIPVIWTAAVAKGADTSLRYSVDQSARELLWLPIPMVVKQRVKPFIDIVVQRAADGVAGVLLLLGIGAAALEPRSLGILTIGVVVLWAIAVLGVRRTYREAIERLLAVRDVDLQTAVTADLDSAGLRELMQELTPDADPDRVRFALDLLAELPSGVLESRALGLLEHPDPGVRLRAIEILEPGSGAAANTAIHPLLDDPAPRVRGRALAFLVRSGSDEHERTIEEWLESGEPALVEAALVVRIERGDEEAVGRVGRLLGRLVRQAGEEAAPLRAACARALGRVRGLHPLQRHLETLLADGHPDVVREALGAVAASPRLDLVPSVLPHLQSGDTRPLARRALARFGEAIVPWLSAAMRDPDLPGEVRRWIPGAFVEIGTPAAYRALVESLPTLMAGRHRLYALKALNKLRRRRPTWAVPAEPVREELERELSSAYDLERQIVVAADARDSGAVPDEAGRLYEDALRHAAESAIERAFRLQGLLYSPQTIYFAYAGLTEGDTTHSAHALELLETSLGREDAARLLPLIDPDLSPDRRAELGGAWYDLPRRDLVEDLERVFESGEPWLQAYAVPLAAEVALERLGPQLERLASTGPEPVRALARRATRPEEVDDMAMTVVEKAAALRRAEILGELGAGDLLQLASVAEERDFDDGEPLFYEGEEGDYLYVVLDGGITVEHDGQEVFRAGPGDTIGTFSILDRRPRSAGAVAVGTVRTLSLHRADMGQVLADNYTLVERIFEYLTGIIREMNERVYSRGKS